LQMEIVLIDTFVVPDESKAEFLETSRAIQDVLKRLPGFVEGFLHEKRAEDGRYDIVTTAVWEDEKAFENAKRVMRTRLQELNINPAARMKALNVQIERGVFTRSSY
jgi:antibiotic biosynthesis monooxygenase (ABM) superfamily enzyme